MYKDILVDINNIDSNLTTLQNDADDNDTHQQATSNNVTTDSDPALEYDARENDKLNSCALKITSPPVKARLCIDGHGVDATIIVFDIQGHKLTIFITVLISCIPR